MIKTRPLTREEAEALEKDLTEVLIKHGAEMGVRASIEILKQEEVLENVSETSPESIISPIQING